MMDPETMMSLMVLTLLGQDPVVITREPRPADRWEQSVTFGCGIQVLQISGYGPARPVGRSVALTMNGSRVAGTQVDTLRRDLGSQRTVYRIVGLCPQRGRGITLLIYSGEKLANGEILFRSGFAYFERGRLRRYSGLSEASPEGFRFR